MNLAQTTVPSKASGAPAQAPSKDSLIPPATAGIAGGGRAATAASRPAGSGTQVQASPSTGGGGMSRGGSSSGGSSGGRGGSSGDGSSSGDDSKPDVSSFPWWKVLAVLGVVGGGYVLKDRISEALGLGQKQQTQTPAGNNTQQNSRSIRHDELRPCQ